jgi:hypothetical protein
VEHIVADFTVGRDLGIGTGLESTLSLGLRYASIKAATSTSLYGTPDWFWPETRLLLDLSRHHEYRGVLESEREFRGAGPVVSWEASSRLFDAQEAGHVDLDVAVSGGVLFGKQQASVTGVETAAYYVDRALLNPQVLAGPIVVTPTAISRSENVTVPTVGVGLGLSYTIDRMSVGAGYRWERYFDAIDGGIGKREEGDRTIDGPYFKIAIGFGG